MREILVKSEEFKDSALGKIPIDWDVVSIDEIAIYVGSGITPRGGSNVYQKEGILFIRSQNVTFNGLRLDDVAYIDNRTHESMKRSEVFAHDVLLNITGASIGRCCPVPPGLDAANVNQHVCAIRLPNPNREDAIFLSSVLASYIGQSQIDRLNAGGNREGLNYEQLRAFVIPFPPPNERASIAKILETVDETIAHTSSLIAKLKQIKAGLLHDLLTRGLDENGELRDAIGHPEQFKDSPLGQIPKDWEPGKIGSHCEIHNHLRKPISAEERDLIRGHYPYYGPTGILDYINEYRVDGEYVLIGEDGDHFLKFTTQPMTLLVSGEFNVNNHAHILKGTERCHTEWIDLFFRHRDITLSLTRQGAGRFKLNKASLENLSLAVPPPDEQIAINKILETHENRIRAEEAYRDKLKLQKKGLMHDLLTGKVRVKDADKFTSASDTV
jgi:type I restriction enzyme S subunit